MILDAQVKDEGLHTSKLLRGKRGTRGERRETSVVFAQRSSVVYRKGED